MGTMTLCYPGEQRRYRQYVTHRGLKLGSVRPIAVHIQTNDKDELAAARMVGCHMADGGKVWLNGELIHGNA